MKNKSRQLQRTKHALPQFHHDAIQPLSLLPICIRGNMNDAKLIDKSLKDKYNNAFLAKYISDKLNIMFANINDFSK